MMEINFNASISALAVHPIQTDKICFGFLDGTIKFCNVDFTKNSLTTTKKSTQFEEKWKRKLKRAIRAAEFSHDGTSMIVTSSNRALCLFDTETGKRFRCIREGHKSRPNALSLLPSKFGDQQFSTGAENGEIKIWDFRQAIPQIAKFKDQEDVINSFCIWKNSLLAASSDGTLAAYDLYKRKMRMQSETMHSELLSLSITDKYTYAGAADGHIEVFNNGEYGNILERIETPMVMGVEQLLRLRNNLLLAAASTQEEMRFVHVNPNKCLGGIPYPEGVDLVTKTADSSFLLVTSADGTKLNTFSLTKIVEEVPELKAQFMHKMKQQEKEERKKNNTTKGSDFFKDMLINDREEEEEEEESDMDEDEDETEDSQSDDEEEEDEQMPST